MPTRQKENEIMSESHSAGILASEIETSIELVAILPAPPHRAFTALTEPRDMEVWVWGGMGSDPRAEVDLRPGGRYSVSIEAGESPRWPRTRWAMHGLYVEVARPSRIVYTVHWDAPVGYNEDGKQAIDEVVIIDLISMTDGTETELRYLHFGVPTAEGAAAHREGIQFTFKMLREHVAQPPPGRTSPK